MEVVDYRHFREEVCDKNRCWRAEPVSEAGVTANVGAGWMYFLSEQHFSDGQCLRRGRSGVICDAVAVPRQRNRKQLIFLEMKAHGKYAKAVDQIRECVAKVLSYGIPSDVALTAEIWHRREPKTTITAARRIDVDGRVVSIRHRRAA